MKNKFYTLLGLVFLILGCEIKMGMRYSYGLYEFKFIDKESISFCGFSSEGIDNFKGDAIYVPEEILGLDVIEIDIGQYPKNVKKLIIPSTVKVIRSSAFSECKGLEYVSLSEGVASIEHHVFLGCSSLKEVSLPSTLKTIGDGAFQECTSLESINLPKGLKIIENSTFYYCQSLKNITLPAGLVTIGSQAFSDCSSLTSVTFKDTSNWYKHAFDNYWEPIDVTDPYENARMLKSSYLDISWQKRP